MAIKCGLESVLRLCFVPHPTNQKSVSPACHCLTYLSKDTCKGLAKGVLDWLGRHLQDRPATCSPKYGSIAFNSAACRVCVAHQVHAKGRSWRLYHCCRHRRIHAVHVFKVSTHPKPARVVRVEDQLQPSPAQQPTLVCPVHYLLLSQLSAGGIWYPCSGAATNSKCSGCMVVVPGLV